MIYQPCRLAIATGLSLRDLRDVELILAQPSIIIPYKTVATLVQLIRRELAQVTCAAAGHGQEISGTWTRYSSPIPAVQR